MVRGLIVVMLFGCCCLTTYSAEPIASPPNNFIESVRRCGQRELDLRGVLLVRSDDGQTEEERPLDLGGFSELLQSLAKLAEWEHVLSDGAQPPVAGVSRLSIRLRVTPRGASYYRVNNGGFSSPEGQPAEPATPIDAAVETPSEAPSLEGEARSPAQQVVASPKPDSPSTSPATSVQETPQVDNGGGFHYSAASVAWTLEWQAEGQVWRASGTGDVEPEHSLSTFRRQPESAPWGAAVARSELPLVLAKGLWDVRGESAALDALLMIAPSHWGGLFGNSVEFQDFTTQRESSEFAAAWNRLRFLAVNSILPRLQVPDDLTRSRVLWHLEQLGWSPPNESEDWLLEICHREAGTGGSARYLTEATHVFGARSIVPLGVVLKTSPHAGRRRAAAEELIRLNTGDSWNQVREAAKAGVTEANQMLSEHAFDWLVSPPFLILLGLAVLVAFGVSVVIQLRNPE